MNLSMRLVAFLLIIMLHEKGDKIKPLIGMKYSPFKLKCLASFFIAFSAFLGGLVFDLFLTFFKIPGNTPVMKPFLIGLATFLMSLIVYSGSYKLLKTLAHFLLFIPLVLTLSLSALFQQANFWYEFSFSLLFFLISALLFLGIMERVKIAPIPTFLQGTGIQLIVLFLIFLSLSFFRGVFFQTLF